MITVEHIRFAKVSQLASLLGIASPNASAILAGRGLSEKTLERASKKGINADVLLKGIALKRHDLIITKKLQAELQDVLGAL
jgi:hypothetical protein